MNARNLVIGVVVLALLGVGGFYAWTHYGPGAAPGVSDNPALAGLPAPVDDPATKAQEGDMVLGDANAPITFIEYSSLSCPHCARHHKNVLPEIKKQYIDTGKVKLVMRDFPLNGPAVQASLLVHCVSPMAYWGMTDQLFATQDQWVNENSAMILAGIAAAAGINGQDFQQCLSDKAMKDKIIASAEQADKAFKVDSTPTFVVNGIVIKGEKTFEEFAKIFDALAPKAN
ncbi:DsbA family protein [Dongia sp.]|uniref:DsbA family protein n=1 Tax=Dongia sp. TaxID=1977262 RepID=UPI0035AECD68